MFVYVFITFRILEFGIPEFWLGLKISISKTFKYSKFEIFYPVKAIEKKSSISKYFYFRKYWSNQYLNENMESLEMVVDKQTNRQTNTQVNKTADG